MMIIFCTIFVKLCVVKEMDCLLCKLHSLAWGVIYNWSGCGGVRNGFKDDCGVSHSAAQRWVD